MSEYDQRSKDKGTEVLARSGYVVANTPGIRFAVQSILDAQLEVENIASTNM